MRDDGAGSLIDLCLRIHNLPELEDTRERVVSVLPIFGVLRRQAQAAWPLYKPRRS